MPTCPVPQSRLHEHILGLVGQCADIEVIALEESQARGWRAVPYMNLPWLQVPVVCLEAGRGGGRTGYSVYQAFDFSADTNGLFIRKEGNAAVAWVDAEASKTLCSMSGKQFCAGVARLYKDNSERPAWMVYDCPVLKGHNDYDWVERDCIKRMSRLGLDSEHAAWSKRFSKMEVSSSAERFVGIEAGFQADALSAGTNDQLSHTLAEFYRAGGRDFLQTMGSAAGLQSILQWVVGHILPGLIRFYHDYLLSTHPEFARERAQAVSEDRAYLQGLGLI